MMDENKIAERTRTTISILIPFLFVIFLWLIYFFELAIDVDFGTFGVYPRHVSGLRGIILMPLIHGGISHLASNSLPLLILGFMMVYFYRHIAYTVFAWIWLLDGSGVWLLAREEYHIGASGLVYGMASFIFFSGILRKNRKLLAVSFAVVFAYGSLIWGMFPYLQDISWEGHLFGFISGIVLSVYYLRKGPPDDRLPEWMNEDELAPDETMGDKSESDADGEIKVTYSFKDEEKKE